MNCSRPPPAVPGDACAQKRFAARTAVAGRPRTSVRLAEALWLAAGFLRGRVGANALPGVVGLLPGGELLDRGFVGLVVLLALRIGRRARLVAERKAERRTAAGGLGWRLAIGGTRQRQDDGCGHDNSHAQVSLRRWRRGARNPRLRSRPQSFEGNSGTEHPI